MSGPTNMPTGPKKEIPPNTEKRISNDGIFIVLPTISGFKKLSINPTINIDQTINPIAPTMFPVKNRKTIAGMEIKAVPTVGNKEANIATVPQRAGFGTPEIQSPKPINIP